jgi:hypothetical protein
VAHAVVGLTVTAPAAWMLFDLSGDPAAPPYPMLLSIWNGIAAMALLSALAFVPIVVVTIVLESRVGQWIVERLNHYSASGPLGTWLVRAESSNDSAEDLLARRAREMAAGWNVLKGPQRNVRASADYNREATAIVRQPSILKLPDQVTALTDVFPYAALATAEAVAGNDPALARRILEPHRRESPARVRWRIRRLDKRLARVTREAEVV